MPDSIWLVTEMFAGSPRYQEGFTHEEAARDYLRAQLDGVDLTATFDENGQEPDPDTSYVITPVVGTWELRINRVRIDGTERN